jgi:hypothetical protein
MIASDSSLSGLKSLVTTYQVVVVQASIVTDGGREDEFMAEESGPQFKQRCRLIVLG